MYFLFKYLIEFLSNSCKNVPKFPNEIKDTDFKNQNISNKALITTSNPDLKNIDINTLNKIFEINSINLESIYYIFFEKHSEVNSRFSSNHNLDKNNNFNILKIYYYDDTKINSCNKYYNREYVNRKHINLNLISPFLYFKRKNNLLIRKIEIQVCNSRIGYKNLETTVKEFNQKIQSRYNFNFGIPKVSIFQNEKMMI